MATTTTTTTGTTAVQPPPEAKLLDKFSDGISALRYLPASVSGSYNSNNNTDTDTSSTTNRHGPRRWLASTSWDGAVRIHDTSRTYGDSASDNKGGSTAGSTAMLMHNMDSGPLLSLATPNCNAGRQNDNNNTSNGSSWLVTGGLDGSVKVLDMETSTSRLLGKHTTQDSGANHQSILLPGVSCLAAMGSFVGSDHGGVGGGGVGGANNKNLVVSASWSRQLFLWDVRQSNASPVTKATLPGKAFAMDVDPVCGRILVATSGRHNCFFDLRKGGRGGGENNDNVFELESVLQRESSLKFQTRCVQFFPGGAGDAFCIGSIEGRVGVEYLDELQQGGAGVEDADAVPNRKKYAFKCHRVNDVVYPVNVLACHPRFHTVFATGGCDGTVVLWDGRLKKKLTALPKFPTSISALAFSLDDDDDHDDGTGGATTELAIASSYTHEEGDREHPRDELYVRTVLDSESIPKPNK